ncbi:MAG: hypothetical protein WEG36_10960 [Gemmatimonadota bacterium]
MDAEFWQPCYIDNAAVIEGHPHVTLGELVTTFRKGIFHILASDYVEVGIPFYRSADVQAIMPSDTRLAFITAERDQVEKKTSLERGDIMLAKTGKHGAAVVLRERCNVSQDVIAAKVKRDDINPFFLAVYLNTRPGQLELRRWFQGQVQEHLSLPDAKRVMVPLLPNQLQKRVQQTVEDAESAYCDANLHYAEAEALLESALELDKLDLTPQLFYERSYTDVQATARFDADYFQPRMQNLIAALSRDGQTIGDMAKLSKRYFRAEAGVEFQYIEIGDVSGNGTADSSRVAGEEAPSRATWIVKPGDIITTTVRPLRRLSAIITEEQGGYVCSSGFAVLTPKDVAPELLLVYLRLPLVCELLDLHTTASMYPAISTADLMKISIVLPKKADRQKIVTKVRESFDARREARRLLDEAKAMVEQTILDMAS